MNPIDGFKNKEGRRSLYHPNFSRHASTAAGIFASRYYTFVFVSTATEDNADT